MKRFRFQKVLAMMLSLGILTTTVFPTTSLAAEVQGEMQEGAQEQMPEDVQDTLHEKGTEEAVSQEQGDKEGADTDIVDEQMCGSSDASELTADEDAVEDETDSSDAESEDAEEDGKTENTIEDENGENEVADTKEDITEGQPEDVTENVSVTPSKVLLLATDTVPIDTFGALEVEQFSGMVRLTYESEDLSQEAFEQFMAEGCTVEYDKSVEMIDDMATAVSEIDNSQVAVEQMETVEELLTEEVAVESEQVRHIKVAVIDTGCDLTAISGRIAEGTDMAITDANGHGTLMAEIIASQTTENVKILPIKAFDDEGTSTVGQVYSAIMSACELGVDVINLSMSGEGVSTLLTKAINYATNQGIIVVVSAGNNASDVEGFMPGNIDSAITVSATDQNEVFAEYSNFGEKVDFSALGEIIQDNGTVETEDDLYYSGTSIAAAFVSGYAACVLDNNHNADVVATFDKYAKDLGETGKDAYYGKGFLSLENISFDVNKDNASDNESTSDEDKADDEEDHEYEKQGIKEDIEEDNEDEEQNLKTSATINVSNEQQLYDAFMSANSSGTNVTVKITSSFTVSSKAFDSNRCKVTIDGGYTDANGNAKRRTIKINGTNSNSGSSYFNTYAYMIGASNGGTVALKNLILDANNMYPNPVTGNAVVTATGGTLTVNNCLFKNVNSGGIGGINAIEAKGGTLTVKDTTIEDNNATGGVCAFTGKNTVTCDNVSVTGGKICAGIQVTGSDDGTAKITNCKTKNVGTGYYLQGLVTLDMCDAENSKNVGFHLNGKTGSTASNVNSFGSGTYGIYHTGTLTMNKAVVCRNNGSDGLYNKGKITINGADFYDNKGNGITNTGSGTITIEPTTENVDIGRYNISGDNKAHPNGGHGISNSGTVTIKKGAQKSDGTYRQTYICYNSNEGIFSSNKLTVYDAIVCHNGGKGVLSSGTATIHSGNFYSNTESGIENRGTLTINDGNVYSNKEYGVLTKGSCIIKKGNFYSNLKNGVANSGEGHTLEVQGGSFYSNTGRGLSNSGTCLITHGVCRNNTKEGFLNGSSGTATIKGGDFYDNTEEGIQNEGELTITPSTENVDVGFYNLNNDGKAHPNATGIYNNGGTLTLNRGEKLTYINRNTKYGVQNTGKLEVNDVRALGSNYGIHNTGTATLNGGEVYSNSNGIHNAAGTTTLSGADVHNNTQYGVYNAGTFTMKGGKVRDNANVDGIYNTIDGTTTISGGTLSGNKIGIRNRGNANISKIIIQSNENGITNEKSGTTTIGGTNITDIEIKSNTYGVYNTADSNGVTINKATVTDNTTADLGQSGETFKMNGANTNTDVIELGVKDGVPEVVSIDGALTEEKTVIIKADPDTMTRADIDQNMSVGRPMFQCINTTPKAILDSGKLVLQSGQQTLMGNGTKRDAIMRPCKGTNSNDSNRKSEDYIVLSTKYAGIYKVKEVIDGVEFDIPDAVDIFWNEDNHITMPELWATIGGVLKKLDIIGWLKDGLGDAVPVDAIMTFFFGESNKDHDIIAQMGNVNLCVNGNGQSEGENYVIEEFNCVTDTLPENTFKKEFLDDYYYIELGEQKQHETKYSYQGWSLSDSATYLSEGVMQPQGKLDYADVLTYMDEHKDSITYGDNGLPNIPLYVVWDKYPELSAGNITIVTGWVDESYSFAKTDAEMQQIIFAKVLGTDDEDGMLTNGVEEKGVICTDYDKEEIKKFKHTGTMTLNFKATDGVGNVTERKVRLYINSSDPLDTLDLDHPELGGAYPNRARCINRRFYDAGKVSLGLELTDAHYLDGYRAGGLMPTDLWYTDPEYAAVIEEAFDNLENDTPQYTWYFTHEQVLETQDYIEEHGFGDSEEEGALRRYFDKYKGSFKMLK